MDLIIKNGTLCDFSGERQADILIREGLIAQIAPTISQQGVETLDAEGLHILPAMVDLCIQPKNYTRSHLQQLQAKAISGGVGAILLSPKSDCYHYEFLNTLCENVLFPYDIQPIIDNQLQNIAILHKSGGRALSFDSSLDSHTLQSLYQYAQMLQIPCLAHHDDNLSAVMTASPLSYELGLSANAPIMQTLDFVRISEMALFYQVPTLLHLIHEKRILEITQNHPFLIKEISIHHLICNEEQYRTYDPYTKLSPPLSTKQTQEFFRSHIDEIDILTSRHTEFLPHQKEQVFQDALAGIDCLSFYFALAYTHLVKTQCISLAKLSQITSYRPAQLINLNMGEINIGRQSNLIVVDLNQQIQINQQGPYKHQTLYGAIQAYVSNTNGLMRL
ncbi:hypothetical protein BBW65_06515 [Helicobacter enhydrae]|uniref:Uncharacterized protein n=1 Tax=Helicobacter enhydrae TaxID=222136 RepID=A0A1B1U6U0_9HELI|nr:amidohydrolase family protein [Helicobacter enhydrae]ANV98470.1 hypothetical protein BBW65_06515 [Helicobacter enhydrae]